MKKLFFILLLLFLAYKYYMYKLKKSFDIKVTGLENAQIDIKNNKAVINLEIIIKNKLMPDIVLNEVNLDIWINDNYLGSLHSNEPVRSHNGIIKLHGAFTSKDLGLTTALMLEPNKFIQIFGKIKIIAPLHLTFNINHYGKF